MSEEIERSKVLCKEYEDELAKIMNDIGDARVSLQEFWNNLNKQKNPQIINI